MGQRHQLFLKVNNPLKSKRNYFTESDKKKARKMFGSGKYTIIALHHQWLYGRSAVCMVNHIFSITNPKTMNDYNNPFGENYSFETLDMYINHLMMMIQVQSNPTFPRGTGIERMHFLNSECIDENDKYTSEWDMRLNFTDGDNNDGVSIIDTIERKYCLMNISYHEKNSNCVYSLPSMTPCSAEDYVNAYYSEKEHLVDNIKYCIPFKHYEVLTINEIDKMFPKMGLKIAKV